MALRSIAVAQSCPVQGDVDANLAEHRRLISAAAAEGAGLVLFPELSLTGYEMGMAARLAFSEDDARLGPLIDAASKLSIVVVAGAPVRLGARLHIGAFVLRPDRTAALYTKHRLGTWDDSARQDGVLPTPEANVFQPGERDPLVRFGGNIGAVAVCADIGAPSHPEHAVERGAKTYLVSMFVTPSGFESDSARLKGFATQHGMVVALSNFGCASGGMAAAGRSSIWSEQGELLVQLAETGTGVAVAIETDGGWQVKRRV